MAASPTSRPMRPVVDGPPGREQLLFVLLLPVCPIGRARRISCATRAAGARVRSQQLRPAGPTDPVGQLGVAATVAPYDWVLAQPVPGRGPAEPGTQLEAVPMPGARDHPVADQALSQRAAVVRARRVGHLQLAADIEHRIAAAVVFDGPGRPAARRTERHQCHAWLLAHLLVLSAAASAYSQPISTLPRRSAVAVTTSPAAIGTAAVSPPDSTMSPARRPSSSAASDLTSQATAEAGWPSAAAPAAVAMTSPLCSSSTPIRRRSSPAAGTAGPMTNRPAEVLSATTSAIVNL